MEGKAGFHIDILHMNRAWLVNGFDYATEEKLRPGSHLVTEGT